MNLTVTLTPQAQQVAAAVRTMPERLLGAVARGLDTGLQYALDRTVAQRFTGKGPFAVSEKRLGVVTGLLRRSIRRTPAVVQGSAITATAGGTNVKYFGVHEFGYDGPVNVRAHYRTRARTGKGEVTSVAKALRSSKSTFDQVEVKAHTRTVKIPARMPLRTGLAENVKLIGAGISSAIVAEWNGNGKALGQGSNMGGLGGILSRPQQGDFVQ